MPLPNLPRLSEKPSVILEKLQMNQGGCLGRGRGKGETLRPNSLVHKGPRQIRVTGGLDASDDAHGATDTGTACEH